MESKHHVKRRLTTLLQYTPVIRDKQTPPGPAAPPPPVSPPPPPPTSTAIVRSARRSRPLPVSPPSTSEDGQPARPRRPSRPLPLTPTANVTADDAPGDPPGGGAPGAFAALGDDALKEEMARLIALDNDATAEQASVLVHQITALQREIRRRMTSMSPPPPPAQEQPSSPTPASVAAVAAQGKEDTPAAASSSGAAAPSRSAADNNEETNGGDRGPVAPPPPPDDPGPTAAVLQEEEEEEEDDSNTRTGNGAPNPPSRSLQNRIDELETRLAQQKLNLMLRLRLRRRKADAQLSQRARQYREQLKQHKTALLAAAETAEQATERTTHLEQQSNTLREKLETATRAAIGSAAEAAVLRARIHDLEDALDKQTRVQQRAPPPAATPSPIAHADGHAPLSGRNARALHRALVLLDKSWSIAAEGFFHRWLLAIIMFGGPRHSKRGAKPAAQPLPAPVSSNMDYLVSRGVATLFRAPAMADATRLPPPPPPPPARPPPPAPQRSSYVPPKQAERGPVNSGHTSLKTRKRGRRQSTTRMRARLASSLQYYGK